MSLSLSDIKSKSLREVTKTLTDDQISALLDVCERVLIGLGVNTDATNFTAIFNAAQLTLFDWYVSNPGFFRSLTQGQVTEAYSLTLPSTIYAMISPIRRGGLGVLYREGGN